MTNKKKIGLLIFAGAFLLLYSIIYLIPGVSGALKKTEVLNYGELMVSDELTGYFVRNEKVYLADRSGDINYYFQEGEHVRKGTKILDILKQDVGEPKDEYENILNNLGGSAEKIGNGGSPYNGIVSYYVDGYESVFTPDRMNALKFKDVSKMKIEPVNLTRETTFSSEPIYKICDNAIWYLIGWVKEGEVSKFVMGNTVEIEMDSSVISAEIENIIEDDDRWLIIMKTDRYYAEFSKTRSCTMRVITARTAGVLIQNESITVDEKGTIGVYVKKKNGDYVFRPIQVINTDGAYSAVATSFFYDDAGNEVETVDVYDEILKNGRE